MDLNRERVKSLTARCTADCHWPWTQIKQTLNYVLLGVASLWSTPPMYPWTAERGCAFPFIHKHYCLIFAHVILSQTDFLNQCCYSGCSVIYQRNFTTSNSLTKEGHTRDTDKKLIWGHDQTVASEESLRWLDSVQANTNQHNHHIHVWTRKPENQRVRGGGEQDNFEVVAQH